MKRNKIYFVTLFKFYNSKKKKKKKKKKKINSGEHDIRSIIVLNKHFIVNT